MVKVGKFNKREIGFLVPRHLANTPFQGVNSVAKKIWFGPIRKNTAAGNTMTVNLRGGTWGFAWIDYCEMHSRCHESTTQGQAGGTVCVFYNHNPTMWLPITLNAAQRCFMFIIGRDNKGLV